VLLAALAAPVLARGEATAPPAPPVPAAASPAPAAPSPVPAPQSPFAAPGGAEGFAGAPFCAGEYADDLFALAPAARTFDQKQPPYTFCVRSSAVYECPSYAPDGSLRRTRRKVQSHGTGFGFRHQGGETLLVTNDHVSEWPAVTEAERPAEDVPVGCKRVSSAARIVDDEADAYERDDVPLARVVTDPQLDVAILRAKATLPVLPWKIGRSAGLRERNVVDVRGFPLGALRANNVGKVISTYNHDDAHDWDHDDFVIDALLSPGNSGSPVLAVSCRTGEFELVGVYHARYVNGSALHHVVGIDQVRDLLTTLRRAPRPRSEAVASGEAAERERLLAATRASIEPFFSFGGVTASVRARTDGALVFSLMSKDFPVQAHPALVLEDLPPGDGGGFGRLGRTWAGNRQGLREVPDSAVDAETRAQLVKTLDALRGDALAAADFHQAARSKMASREGFQELKRLERALRRTSTSRGDLVAAALEASEQLCPRFADAPVTLADALVPLPGGDPAEGSESPWRPVAFGGEPASVVPIPLAPPR
jgi:S1-C subfamily serine protease